MKVSGAFLYAERGEIMAGIIVMNPEDTIILLIA